jgi:hypothetical protein
MGATRLRETTGMSALDMFCGFCLVVFAPRFPLPVDLHGTREKGER